MQGTREVPLESAYIRSWLDSSKKYPTSVRFGALPPYPKEDNMTNYNPIHTTYLRIFIVFILGMLIVALLASCVSHPIEDRCYRAGLQINTLSIEETFTGQQRSKVECGKGSNW